MLFRTAAASAAMMACTSTQVAAAEQTSAARCWRADEARAARLQRLQTALMIDAIKCQDTIPATLESYNAFLGKQRDLLVANKYMVQAHFVRLLGPTEGIKAATNYDTQLGNRLSASGIDVKRCESTGLYARLATTATEDDLLAMAAIVGGDPDMMECPASEPVATKPTNMVIPVWPKPVAIAQAPAPPPAGAATPDIAPNAAVVPIPAVATTGAAAGSLPSSRPVKAAAVARPYGPEHVATLEQQRSDTLKALQNAAAALSQAAAALQPTTVSAVAPVPAGLSETEE